MEKEGDGQMEEHGEERDMVGMVVVQAGEGDPVRRRRLVLHEQAGVRGGWRQVVVLGGAGTMQTVDPSDQPFGPAVRQNSVSTWRSQELVK